MKDGRKAPASGGESGRLEPASAMMSILVFGARLLPHPSVIIGDFSAFKRA